MRIVQSFWSCNKNILQDGFAWSSPQYHIMAWALSCLKLREHYKDVHLYTDSNGYKILIDYLNLPYKTVEICYDDIDHYNQNIWAISKIKTYAAQKKPFIHVDGDVFIWKKFPVRLERASLIAQNTEISTEYYEKAINEITGDLTYLPNFLRKQLSKKPIASYNAGILGGSNIKFFENYTQIALQIIEKNATSTKALSSGFFNILFEQILFASLAKKEGKEVSCYFEDEYKDNGYTIRDVTDFTSANHKLNYMHLIGTHKRNTDNCEQMSQVLFKEYPEYFLKIAALFNEEHTWFSTKLKAAFPALSASNIIKTNTNKVAAKTPYPKTLQAIMLKENTTKKLTPAEIKTYVANTNNKMVQALFKYEKRLLKPIRNWEKIPTKELYLIESTFIVNNGFFFSSKKNQIKKIISKNCFLEILETGFDQAMLTPELLNKEEAGDLITMACVPGLFFKGYSETAIDELEYNILAFLDEPVPLENLLKQLEVCFSKEEIENDYNSFFELILLKLKHLYVKKCIFIS